MAPNGVNRSPDQYYESPSVRTREVVEIDPVSSAKTHKRKRSYWFSEEQKNSPRARPKVREIEARDNHRQRRRYVDHRDERQYDRHKDNYYCPQENIPPCQDQSSFMHPQPRYKKSLERSMNDQSQRNREPENRGRSKNTMETFLKHMQVNETFKTPSEDGNAEY